MKCNLRKHACCVAVNFMYPSLQKHVARPISSVHSVLALSQNLEHMLFTEKRVKISET